MATAPEAAKTVRMLTKELWAIPPTVPHEMAQTILQPRLERRAAFGLAGALEDFDKLIADCPDYSEGFDQRVFIGFMRRSYRCALDDLKASLPALFDYVGAVVGRSMALLQLGGLRNGQIARRARPAQNP